MSDTLTFSERAMALEWYREHHTHVDRMLARHVGAAFPPSGSDRIRPELWKSAHWMWLIPKLTP